MSGKTINFNNKKIRKSSFYKIKNIYRIDDTDATNILVSKKEPYGTKNSLKYFIGYKGDNDIIEPFCIRLSKITGYAKRFNENATMCFKVNHKKTIKEI